TWLVNTGWTGGAYGTGHRIKLSATRAMVRAALSGALDHATFEKEAAFGLEIPTAIEGVDSELLRPRDTWADPAAYDRAAAELKARFDENAASYA
ncbi:MAG: phosphoenolpyruvate carboxykinase (ATP), partial [Armatimonadota bacterium]